MYSSITSCAAEHLTTADCSAGMFSLGPSGLQQDSQLFVPSGTTREHRSSKHREAFVACLEGTLMCETLSTVP